MRLLIILKYIGSKVRDVWVYEIGEASQNGNEWWLGNGTISPDDCIRALTLKYHNSFDYVKAERYDVGDIIGLSIILILILMFLIGIIKTLLFR